MQIKNILLPTDFSKCSDRALAHAAFIAAKHGATLYALHVVTLHEDDPHDDRRTAHRDDFNARIKDAIAMRMSSQMEQNEHPSVKVHHIQRRDIAPGPSILAYAQEREIDLIVMGTHGRRGVRHLMLGSVAEEVVRHAPCPVLTIRGDDSVEVPALKKILVPVDFSEHSKLGVSYAKQVASIYNASLEVLHVVEQTVHPSFYTIGQLSPMDALPEIQETSEREMKSLVEDSEGPPAKANYSVISGHPAYDIVEFAKNNGCDLIVLPTQGLTGLAHFLMGSVAERVVRRSPCPVLTVKTGSGD